VIIKLDEEIISCNTLIKSLHLYIIHLCLIDKGGNFMLFRVVSKEDYKRYLCGVMLRPDDLIFRSTDGKTISIVEYGAFIRMSNAGESTVRAVSLSLNETGGGVRGFIVNNKCPLSKLISPIVDKSSLWDIIDEMRRLSEDKTIGVDPIVRLSSYIYKADGSASLIPTAYLNRFYNVETHEIVTV
jgi:hypothetical protein